MWPSPLKTPAGRPTCVSPSVPRTPRRPCPSPAAPGHLTIHAPTETVPVMLSVMVTVTQTQTQTQTPAALDTDTDTA